jgi:hypothetical protein
MRRARRVLLRELSVFDSLDKTETGKESSDADDHCLPHDLTVIEHAPKRSIASMCTSTLDTPSA